MSPGWENGFIHIAIVEVPGVIFGLGLPLARRFERRRLLLRRFRGSGGEAVADLLETKNGSLGWSGPRSEAAVLVVNVDVSVHADVNLNASAGVGCAAGVGLELDAIVADADDVVGGDGAIEFEREQRVEFRRAGEFAPGTNGIGRLHGEALVEGEEEWIEDPNVGADS